MSRITFEGLKKAIEMVLEENDMEPTRAEDMAEKVMNLFGYDKTITDNLLSPRERDTFYKLEDLDILFTEEESTNLPSGKKWRIHYWVLNEKKIRELLEEEQEIEDEEDTEKKTIYEDLSDEVWERGST
ncbi:MAG: hypothetical protein KGY66_00305 [Candidatus Thermoplasmatota archaeon]|nr:hypothetical protein [Candidatus Thermoplasmatota archaeon]MBS3789345.1 hypothetical protein [Candidatus Thermoplasmatota archaeon]